MVQARIEGLISENGHLMNNGKTSYWNIAGWEDGESSQVPEVLIHFQKAGHNTLRIAGTADRFAKTYMEALTTNKIVGIYTRASEGHIAVGYPKVTLIDDLNQQDHPLTPKR